MCASASFFAASKNRERSAFARIARQMAALIGRYIDQVRILRGETRALIRSRVFFGRARNTYQPPRDVCACVTFVARGK